MPSKKRWSPAKLPQNKSLTGRTNIYFGGLS
jgi:hypothetical protein